MKNHFYLTNLTSLLDSSGIYGGIFDYTLVFAFFFSAVLAFLFFWSRGRLDMDEEPKLQMMKDEQEME
jgi:cbb3-type cytochrome oxidase subunit 3